MNDGAISAASVGSQVGKQREALGGPGQQHHLVAATAMPGCHGVDCPLFVDRARVAAQVLKPRRQPLDQPGGRLVVRTLTAKSSMPGPAAWSPW